MSQEQLPSENDPDTYLIEHSVPDVRAFEQKTRYFLCVVQQNYHKAKTNSYNVEMA